MRFLKNSELGRPDLPEYKSIKKIPVVVVLDNVRSGLNVGSIFRTSDSFLAERVVLCGITACPPDRDILKSALGATESVKWLYFDTSTEAVIELKKEGYKILAIEQSESGIDLDRLELDLNDRYAIIFGHEVKGVDENLIPLVDGCIEIPQSGIKHSLNVSVCAGIVLWKFYEALYLKRV